MCIIIYLLLIMYCSYALMKIQYIIDHMTEIAETTKEHHLGF